MHGQVTSVSKSPLETLLEHEVPLPGSSRSEPALAQNPGVSASAIPASLVGLQPVSGARAAGAGISPDKIQRQLEAFHTEGKSVLETWKEVLALPGFSPSPEANEALVQQRSASRQPQVPPIHMASILEERKESGYKPSPLGTPHGILSPAQDAASDGSGATPASAGSSERAQHPFRANFGLVEGGLGLIIDSLAIVNLVKEQKLIQAALKQHRESPGHLGMMAALEKFKKDYEIATFEYDVLSKDYDALWNSVQTEYGLYNGNVDPLERSERGQSLPLEVEIALASNGRLKDDKKEELLRLKSRIDVLEKELIGWEIIRMLREAQAADNKKKLLFANLTLGIVVPANLVSSSFSAAQYAGTALGIARQASSIASTVAFPITLLALYESLKEVRKATHLRDLSDKVIERFQNNPVLWGLAQAIRERQDRFLKQVDLSSSVLSFCWSVCNVIQTFTVDAAKKDQVEEITNPISYGFAAATTGVGIGTAVYKYYRSYRDGKQQPQWEEMIKKEQNFHQRSATNLYSANAVQETRKAAMELSKINPLLTAVLLLKQLHGDNARLRKETIEFLKMYQFDDKDIEVFGRLADAKREKQQETEYGAFVSGNAEQREYERAPVVEVKTLELSSQEQAAIGYIMMKLNLQV